MDYTLIDSPVGTLLALAAADTLVGLYFMDAAHAPRPGDDWSASPRHAVLQDTRRQLEEYFGERRRTFELPLRPTGTQFQSRVWRACRPHPVWSYPPMAAGSPRLPGGDLRGLLHPS
jgi:methylated-DNA-[protein]-cysteine S-methyltransferase